MSLKNPNQNEGTDVRLPRDANKLGVDGNGATHYFSAYRNTAVVHEPDDSVHTFDLDNTPCDKLSEWIDHVEVQRGEWRTLNYRDGGPFAALVDQLAEAFDDD